MYRCAKIKKNYSGAKRLMWKRHQIQRRVPEEALQILQRRYKYFHKDVWGGRHRNRRCQINLRRSHKIASVEAIQMYVFCKNSIVCRDTIYLCTVCEGMCGVGVRSLKVCCTEEVACTGSQILQMTGNVCRQSELRTDKRNSFI
jgi:hypothetical protein